jgi:hypothetical protein
MLLGRVFSRMGAKSGAIVALLIGLTGCTTVGQFSGAASGWKIAPADTRLIRVATNLNYEAPHRQLPMTKFVDLQSDRLLMLVYFDRPCQLTGAIAERAGSHDEVDVTVGEAGLHWLEATGGASELTHVVRHASGTITPIFVANLPAK